MKMEEPEEKNQDEINWQDYAKKPEKLFGFAYIYALLVLVMIGFLYIGSLDNVGRNEILPAVFSDSTGLAEDIPLQSPRSNPPVDVMKAALPSPEAIARGKSLFQANCISCHGEDGRGDGPSAALLDPRPRNFHSLAGWVNGSRISQIYKTLQEGMPGSGMASYDYMSPQDRFALIHYVRTFTPDQPTDAPDDLKQLDAVYSLSKGIRLAGQIPVKKALRIIESETAAAGKEIQKLVVGIETSGETGAGIFKRESIDRPKALTSLIRAGKAAKNMDEFIAVVNSDPIESGLRPSICRMSVQDWRSLYGYMLSIIRKEGASLL